MAGDDLDDAPGGECGVEPLKIAMWRPRTAREELQKPPDKQARLPFQAGCGGNACHEIRRRPGHLCGMEGEGGPGASQIRTESSLFRRPLKMLSRRIGRR